ncbi:MAG: hypothetical protein COV95_01880 [Candidatus Zambryskibacteria bacterium CG11_big_fil_rev_8_21_14_0_20_40_24]|uniref:Uncharacterized protein n=1 Tax=Candidatus Zambryskibacteria bacterium CG11_big_fil_rev_8_21_14_0_20_40_24 TaxID=1975116 RepID=A0A2H0K6J2_9BACT|nr:MAG: hypothetical protein COV95_01880 [Candidatus Zambryskibacteria bacterium CG11_big_fil_rev_8_21_14_0_20_40_24]
MFNKYNRNIKFCKFVYEKPRHALAAGVWLAAPVGAIGLWHPWVGATKTYTSGSKRQWRLSFFV